VTLCGMGVGSWSRIALGKYWSDKVILQTEHQLIRNGPYSRMRHPLYSGVLLAVLGTALVLGQVRGLVSFVVLLVNYAIKAKREESNSGGEVRARVRNASPTDGISAA
jgi:protein-S-isoprenylcysteine O-methyltransferase Ste14